MITPQDLSANDLTDEFYECVDFMCDCEQSLFFVCETDYSLIVGEQVGYPKELLFIAEGVDVRLSNERVPFWDQHKLSNGQSIRWTCSGCGEVTAMPIGGPSDDELIIPILKTKRYPRPVPTRCVPYIKSLDALDPDYVERAKADGAQ